MTLCRLEKGLGLVQSFFAIGVLYHTVIKKLGSTAFLMGYD